MFSFLEHVYQHINAGEAVSAVFCDLSKAFDCVDHGILLAKLERFGFRGEALQWFASYLGGRRQSVVVPGARSSVLEVHHGVPQGSVLGPLLFLVYVNDLSLVNITGRFTFFADDTSIVWHDNEAHRLRYRMSEDLAVVKSWCNANRLSFNVAKTSLVYFRGDVQGVQLEGGDLQAEFENGFLGVRIDSGLRFESHIMRLGSKLSSACFAVRTTRCELGLSVARTVYFALCESHLRYGIPFWGAACQKLLNVIFILQKKAVRAIVNAGRRDSCRPHFISQRILTLTSLFILETASLIFKYPRNDQDPVRVRITRQIRDLPLPVPTSALVQRSIIYEGRKIFNHLPIVIRNARGLKHFRKMLKTFLIGKAYYRLDEYFDDDLNTI